MAWRSSGNTNEELVRNLMRNGVIHTDSVTMLNVDRAHYVVDKATAYEDSPQYIGYDATISAPHMHAHAVENLLPFLRPGAHVLDIGSGSGYLVALFHQLVSDDNMKGKVVGVEHIPQLVDWSVTNLKKDGRGKALESGEIVMIARDGRKGYPEDAPYDAIHVGAAAPTVPDALIDQLKSPGRMFIPVGTLNQAILQIDKDENGSVTSKELFDVMYVPLTDRDKQLGSN